MKPAVIIGALLIVIGIIGFIAGGVSFTHDKKLVDAGPLQIDKKETNTFPISPVLSGIAVIGGIVLVTIGSKKG